MQIISRTSFVFDCELLLSSSELNIQIYDFEKRFGMQLSKYDESDKMHYQNLWLQESFVEFKTLKRNGSDRKSTSSLIYHLTVLHKVSPISSIINYYWSKKYCTT